MTGLLLLAPLILPPFGELLHLQHLSSTSTSSRRKMTTIGRVLTEIGEASYPMQSQRSHETFPAIEENGTEAQQPQEVATEGEQPMTVTEK
ncbi:MAG: hypothetical protein Q9226_007710, partial [Calogaya cf. arnoldii]